MTLLVVGGGISSPVTALISREDKEETSDPSTCWREETGRVVDEALLAFALCMNLIVCVLSLSLDTDSTRDVDGFCVIIAASIGKDQKSLMGVTKILPPFIPIYSNITVKGSKSSPRIKEEKFFLGFDFNSHHLRHLRHC